MELNLKTEPPDETLPADGYLFGADSQTATRPSVYPINSVVDRIAAQLDADTPDRFVREDRLATDFILDDPSDQVLLKPSSVVEKLAEGLPDDEASQQAIADAIYENIRRATAPRQYQAYDPAITRVTIDDGFIGLVRDLESVADNGSGGAVFTSTAHGWANGDAVRIAGTTNYDGGRIIDSVTDDTFEITGLAYSAETFDGATVELKTYRHVPGLAVKSPTHLVAVAAYNDTTTAEAADNSRVCVYRSANDGDTWSPKADEFYDAATATNPFEPDPDEWHQESFVFYDRQLDLEIATSRFNVNNHAGYIHLRNAASPSPAVNRWTNYRVLFADADNSVSLSSSSLTGAAPSGQKLTMTIEGEEFNLQEICKPFYAFDGRLIFPIVFRNGPPRTKARTAFLVRDADLNWSVMGFIQVGESAQAEIWEPTVWQLPDGSFQAKARNLSQSGSARVVVAASLDLNSWTPWMKSDDDIRDKRHIYRRVDNELYLGVGRANDTTRTNMALLASGDGRQWVYGTEIGNKVVGDWTGYADIDFHGSTVYAIYSDQEFGSNNPNAIYFARLPMPESLPIMASNKNWWELGGGTKPTFSGDVLVVPPRMVGAVPTRGNCFQLTMRQAIDTLPNSVPYKLLSIGDRVLGYFTVEVRNDEGTANIYANGDLIQEVTVGDYFSYNVIVNVVERYVMAFGRRRNIGGFARTFIGDTDPGGSDQAGNILTDCAKCWITETQNDLLSGIMEIPPNEWLLRPRTGPAMIRVRSDNAEATLVADGASGTTVSVALRINGDQRAQLSYNPNTPRTYIRSFAEGAWREVLQAAATYTRLDAPATWQLRAGAIGSEVISLEGNNQRAIVQRFLNFGAATDLTIGSDAITVTRSFHRVDTEGAAATDDLSTINGGTEGDIVFLQSVNSARDTTVKHGVGNINCGSDRVLNNVADIIVLKKRGSVWDMISYFDN
jgi:hypothetical protein